MECLSRKTLPTEIIMQISLKLSGSPAAIIAFLQTVPADLLGATHAPTAPAMPVFSEPVGTLGGAQIVGDDEEAGVASTSATDIHGLPWDERIHAGNKTTNKDGSWRRRKGVAEALVLAVEAELRGSSISVPLAPVPLSQPVAPLMPPMPMPEPVAVPMPLPSVAIPQPVAMAAPAPTPLPEPVVMVQPAPVAAPVAPAGDLDFTGFMGHLTTLMGTGRVTPDYLVEKVQQINAAYAPYGGAALNSITDLGSDPTKMTYAVQLMTAEGRW
jgi:hypothetical protein